MSTQNIATHYDNEIKQIKIKQKAAWEDGDYADFATHMHNGAVEIIQDWNLEQHNSLLDVGCGSGQTAIPAAKMGLEVTGLDVAENLIEYARKQAAKQNVKIRFDAGDAEALPYNDNSFDSAISLIGAMFAPRPDLVASEFARVIKPGGKLYMANWTPESMPAEMFKCLSQVVPPPPGFISPVLWGDEQSVIERLQDNFTNIKLTRKFYPQWHYPFDEHGVVELFRTQFGPAVKAFSVANEAQRQKLYNQLFHIYRDNSESHNGILTITGGEYLEVIATRNL